MLLTNIKKLIPARVKAYIKMGNERKNFSKMISEMEADQGKYDILLGTPIHTNLGDHLITLAEIQMMRELNPNKKIYEIPSEVYQFYKKRIKKAVNISARVFVNGGGWMGNLWPNEEMLLQDMIYSFHNHKIVIFPQTVFYDFKIQNFGTLIYQGNKIYDQCTDITLFVRDRRSYEFAVANLNIKKVKLVPDIALYYSVKRKRKKRGNIVGTCMRKDREQSSDLKFVDQIYNALIEKGFRLREISTINDKRVRSYERGKICSNQFRKFSACNIIITDRLHAMIFSFLTGTPCIVFDNKTKKVSGVYNQWLSECKSIFPVFNQKDLNEVVSFVQKNACQPEWDKNKNFTEFSLIKKEVRYGEN